MSGPVPPRSVSELKQSDALALAATMPVGRLAHLHGEQLSVIPVNFLLEGGDVLMRTSEGTDLLDAARRGAPAALEVDDLVEWSRSGWSVLLRGQLSEVTDPASVERVLDGPLHAWAGAGRNHVVRLVGEQVTGRRIEPGPGGTTLSQL